MGYNQGTSALFVYLKLAPVTCQMQVILRSGG